MGCIRRRNLRRTSVGRMAARIFQPEFRTPNESSEAGQAIHHEFQAQGHRFYFDECGRLQGVARGAEAPGKLRGGRVLEERRRDSVGTQTYSKGIEIGMEKRMATGFGSSCYRAKRFRTESGRPA